MKRPLLIILGAIIVVLLIAAWVYILFFAGSPSNGDDTYANLNLGDTTDTTTVVENTDTEPEPTVDVASPERLRQLTTVPTAGYQLVAPDASTTPMMYYIEAGTGHIFSINLENGEEERVSGTTVPLTQTGAITPDGRYALLQSGSGVGAEFVVGTLSSTSDNMTTGIIDERIVSFTSTPENTFLYAAKTNNSVIGKEYHPDRDVSKTLFTVPFREAAIAWGPNADSTHFVYPKATSQLEGFAYQVVDGTLVRLPIDGYGLSVAGTAVGALYSKQENGVYNTYSFQLQTGTTLNNLLALTVIPEKCGHLQNNRYTLICGADFTLAGSDLPDSWYRGEQQAESDLWEVDLQSNSASYLLDTAAEAGRPLDTVSIKSSADGAQVYFLNKTDQTLWLFQRLLTEGTN